MESGEPLPLPTDPTLAAIAAGYEAAGACSIIRDREWFLVFATSEFMQWDSHRLVPGDPPQHWFGPEVTEYMQEAFGHGHSRRHEFLLAGPWVLFGTPGGREVLRKRVDPSLVDLVGDIEPAPPPMIVGGNHTEGTGTDLRTFGARSDISISTMRVNDSVGSLVGSVTDYRPAAGMSQVFTSLQLADLRHVERMSAVARPGRRPGAVLFADLEASTPLSKRVSTAQYFAFGRRLVRAVDQCLIDHGGIVGRHAGDGVTGFFLAETAGSESTAARSCIEAARALPGVVAAAVERSDLHDESVTFRFGLHWGARLYVGQIQTAGRSEVTALGDEVNDAARIEACASGGRTLASKDLIECLTAQDAEALGIDLGRAKYTVLAELSTATEKARRDAPAIAVCDVTN
jgi:class 3 adenylate cyclase